MSENWTVTKQTGRGNWTLTATGEVTDSIPIDQVPITDTDANFLVQDLVRAFKQLTTDPRVQWDLSSRAGNILTRLGVTTVWHLTHISATELVRTRGLGRMTLSEIIREAASRRLPVPNWQQAMTHLYDFTKPD